jgi:hypothetical protein
MQGSWNAGCLNRPYDFLIVRSTIVKAITGVDGRTLCLPEPDKAVVLVQFQQYVQPLLFATGNPDDWTGATSTTRFVWD